MISIQGEIHSSKNSRQVFRNRATGRPFVVKSDVSKADESLLADQLSDNKHEWEAMKACCGYPLSVVFYFRRKTKARWDFANLVQGVADAMVKAGYLPDDDVRNFIPIFGGYRVDKDNPGVDFWIIVP